MADCELRIANCKIKKYPTGMDTHQNAGNAVAQTASDGLRAPANPQSAIRNPQSGDSPFLVVLCGNPNSGKTTLFNALTGLRARVGNYAGVTVERKEGRLAGGPAGLADHRAGFAGDLQPQPAIAG